MKAHLFFIFTPKLSRANYISKPKKKLSKIFCKEHNYLDIFEI